MKSFIFDYETLSNDASDCVVVDCSYVIFDWDRFTSENPYTFRELVDMVYSDKLNVKDQVSRFGYKIKKSTLDWWSEQGEEAKEKLKPSSTDITVENHISNLLNYIKDSRVKYWWSRSNTFDPIILYRMAKDVGRKDELDTYLSFWLVRDTRTFIDAKFSFKNKTNGFIPMQDEKNWETQFRAHMSSHDIAADVLRLQTLTRFENELPILE